MIIMPVKKGDKVKVDYSGFFESGLVFDSSDKHGPVEFRVGDGKALPGLEKAVLGMEKGEEKEFTFTAREFYGEKDPHTIREIPKKGFPSGEKLKPGMKLNVRISTGEEFPAEILKVKTDSVLVGVKHRLADKVLRLRVKVLEVK